MFDQNNPDQVWKEWKTNRTFPSLVNEGGMSPEQVMALREVEFQRKLLDRALDVAVKDLKEVQDTLINLKDSLKRLEGHLEELWF